MDSRSIRRQINPANRFYERSDVERLNRSLRRLQEIESVHHMESDLLRRENLMRRETQELLKVANNSLKAKIDEVEQTNARAQALTQELRIQTEQLEKSNQDLEQFAYVASHDLKSPLRAIISITEWLGEDLKQVLESDEKMVRFDPKIKKSIQDNLTLLGSRANRMQNLLDDLLAYSKVGRQHHQLEEVNWREFIKDIADLQDVYTGFEIKITSGPTQLRVEKPPLEIVLRNLISNSIKHHDKDQGTIKISLKEQKNHFEFSVTDDGPGIPPEHHQKIFEIFQTLESRDKVEGSGMGLAVIKKIIKFYKGVMKVESPVDQRGTTFTFTWQKE